MESILCKERIRYLFGAIDGAQERDRWAAKDNQAKGTLVRLRIYIHTSGRFMEDQVWFTVYFLLDLVKDEI